MAKETKTHQIVRVLKSGERQVLQRETFLSRSFSPMKVTVRDTHPFVLEPGDMLICEEADQPGNESAPGDSPVSDNLDSEKDSNND